VSLSPEAAAAGVTEADLRARVLPQDLPAEAAVICAAMTDPNALALVSWLRPDEFYSEANRRIYEAALWLQQQGTPVDLVTVAGRLRDTDRLVQVGGTPYLASISDATPSYANVETYAEIVREKARLRALIATCQTTAAAGYTHKGPVIGLITEHEQTVFDIASDAKADNGSRAGAAIESVFAKVTEAARRGDDIVGVPTGFERIDAMMAGLHKGELTIVAARPGMGKTSLVMNVAKNIAGTAEVGPGQADDGAPVQVYRNGVFVASLEMLREQLAGRMACSEARVDSSLLRTPRAIGMDQWSRLTKAATDLYQLPIWIDDTPNISVLELRAAVVRRRAEWAREGVNLVAIVLDYLQLASGDQSCNREGEISSISRGLKGLSKVLEVPVIALSQLNRSVETRGKDKRPQLSDLRESGAIEQDADNVLFIHRDDYYERDSPEKGIAEIIVAKQRNGPTGKVKVKWTGQYTRFDNLEAHEYPGDDDGRYGN
jgi:replicative DNA helicase